MLRLPQRWRSIGQARDAVANQLKARHFLRVHALLLFAWTFASGYLMSQFAFAAGIPTLPMRYTLTSVTGYLAFLLGVRAWLWHVGAMTERSARELDAGDVVDLVDITSDVANISFDNAAAGGDILGGLGDGLGAAAGEGCLPILLIGLLAIVAALLVALFGPELLIEIAFEAVLAGSLVGAMRLGREPDWLWTVFRKTIWIFLVILCAMLWFGKYAQKHYPQATTTKQVIHQMMGHDALVSSQKKP